jgi:hypothetical protein
LLFGFPCLDYDMDFNLGLDVCSRFSKGRPVCLLV